MRGHATLFAALIGVVTSSCGSAAGPRTSTPEGAAPPSTPLTSTSVTTLVIAAPPEEAPRPSTEPQDTPLAAGREGSSSMFHGDAARTGFSEAPSVRSPKVAWRAKVGIQGWLNAPVIQGGVVLVPSSGTQHNSGDALDGVSALTLASGELLWRARFPKDANGAAVASNRVFATCDDGNVYALDLQTGDVLWKRRGVGKMYSAPLLVDDIVVVGDSAGTLRAFLMSDGAPQWQTQLSGAIRGGASADSSRIYAVSQGGQAVALDASGKVLWKKSLTRPGFSGGAATAIEAYAPPLVTPLSVVVTFARDTTYESPAIMALDKKSGAVLWEAQGQPGMTDWGNLRSTPALTNDGTLVFGEPYSGDVAAVNSRDGLVRYRRTLGPCFFPQWASPAATADLVYLPRFDGALYAIRPDTGRPLWQLYLGDSTRVSASLPSGHRSGGCAWDVPSGSPLYSPPAIAADGTIIVGTGEGFVFAIVDSSRP